jgi:hypothetical protein
MKSMLLRLVLTVCLCATLMISGVHSAIATPIKGEATHPAKEYEQTAKDAIDQGGPNSLEGIMSRQSEGSLNEIQGTTGIEDMKRPSNSQGETIEQKIKKGLDKVQDKAKDAME